MGDVSRPGFIVGLRREAGLISRPFGQQPPPIFCSGANPSRVAFGIAELRRQGADCLVSFGFAGGLDPSLAAGDIILADAIVTVDGRRFAVDKELTDRIRSALAESRISYRAGMIAGTDRVIASPADKRAIASATAALAVDMESHAMAAAGDYPIAVLRVVIDPAERAIPALVLNSLDPNGNVQSLKLIARLARQPTKILNLLALAGDSGKARRSLALAAAVLARVFG